LAVRISTTGLGGEIMTGFTLTDVLGSEVVCCKAGEAGNGFILGLKNKTTIFKTPDKRALNC